MNELSLIQKVAVWSLPVLFAITVHETAHGWMARKLGDPTAYMLGRLTLNPLKHIDLVGTILVPLLMILISPFVFGWAKPVPVAWKNLSNPKRDMALVALAGPIANFLMAVAWALLMRVLASLGSMDDMALLFALLVCTAGMFINSVLFTLNLLPLPPLDGGRIITGVLPLNLSLKFAKIEPYGLVILIVLLVLGWLSIIITPIVFFMLAALAGLAGVTFSTLLAFVNVLFG